jgi:hypothetical protein
MLLAVIACLVWGQPASDQEASARLSDYDSCAITCLYAASRIRGADVSFDRVRELMGPAAADGTHSFGDMQRAATALGLASVGVAADRKSIQNLPFPMIAQVRLSKNPSDTLHFVVLLSRDEGGYYVLDPPFPHSHLDFDRFFQIWSGRLFLLPPNDKALAAVQTLARDHVFSRDLKWIGLAVTLGLFAVVLWKSRRALSGSEAPRLLFSEAVRAILLIAATVGVIAVLVIWQINSAVAECSFSSPVIQLGELAPGKISRQISVLNTGKDVLRVSAIRSSCTCAAVVVGLPEEIHPGGAGYFKVEINVAPGPKQVRFFVDSNDPQGSKYVLLTWHGITEPNLVPYRVFGESDWENAEKVARTIRISYPGGLDAVMPVVEKCECDSPLVSVKAGKNNPLANRFDRASNIVNIVGEQELIVNVQRPPRPGEVAAKCNLKVKYGTKTVDMHLPVQVNFVDNRLSISEDSIILFAGPSLSQGTENWEREIELQGRLSSSPLRIGECPPWLNVTLCSESNKRPAIRIRLLSPPRNGVFRGAVRVTSVRHPDAQVSLVVHAVGGLSER